MRISARRGLHGLAHGVRLVIWALAVLLAGGAAAQPQSYSPVSLSVEIAGYVGNECTDAPRHAQLAGSQTELVLRIIDRRGYPAYRGLPLGPPDGFTYEFYYPDSTLPSPELRRQLEPRFYLTHYQLLIDSTFLLTGKVGSDSRPQYHFLLTLPGELAGQRLCVRVRLVDPEYGPLEGAHCVDVIAPCTKGDRNHVLATWVHFAMKSRNYGRAITLADSLSREGWQDWLGLMDAQMAALVVKDYDYALQFLERLYTAYGNVSGSRLGDAGERQEYERQRRFFIEQKNQQQSQPQPDQR